MPEKLLPGQRALDTVVEGLLAGDHVSLEDPDQGDLSAAQPNGLIAHQS
jgi:hypothetical protein